MRARRTAMSITMSTTTHPFDPLTWKQADTDVHVATRGGEFAGFVEFDGRTHVTHDQRGTALGAFDSLDAARRALESTHAAEPARRSFTFTLPRIPRRRPRRARA